MKLVEVTWNPSKRQLRQFAAICVVALPLLGWIWGGSWQIIGCLAAAGFAVGLVGVLAPAAIKPAFIALTVITLPIGIVIGELTLVLVFFGVLLPLGLFFRLIKRDALQLKIDGTCPTYWQPKKQPSGLASYYRQS
jgi:hypothetical protein